VSIKARSIDDQGMVIENKNTSKDGIGTELVRRQGVKRNQELPNWVERKGRLLKDAFKVSI
jgi:hypothetical protein